MSQWSRNQTVEVTQEGSPLVQYGRILRVGARRMTVALLNQDGQALGSFRYDVRDGREAGPGRHFPAAARARDGSLVRRAPDVAGPGRTRRALSGPLHLAER